MDKRQVGVLGGGQLGRMLIEAANRLNIQVNVLDAPNAPAKQISAHEGHIDGSFKDAESIQKLAKQCDVVTVEIEHVDTHMLEQIADEVRVEPHWSTLRLIQNKYNQKEFLRRRDIPVAHAVDLERVTDFADAVKSIGYPFMLKSKTDAYDGKGNVPVKAPEELEHAVKQLGDRPLYAEQWANFTMELAVMVVKTKDGTLSYPTVETVHEDSICKLVYAPARKVSAEINEQAQELARKAIACFDGKGVFGVEMFLLQDDSLLINEIAPRPHNSGHYTIEACPVSQYDAHLRAILDLPIPESSLKLREPAIMLNILGGDAADSHIKVAEAALSNPRTSIHLYGKGDARRGRKMGHVTITAPTMSEAETLVQPLIDAVDKAKRKHVSSKAAPRPLPRVAVIMGSDSDLPKLRPAFEILQSFGVPYQARITSAHRTPDWMREFVKSAEENGFEVIVAAAGGAAHLPGMAASWTTLPVVGLPIKGSVRDGEDSVWSILQMPRGEPVATVGIDNAVNAALMACRILGVSDLRVREELRGYARRNAEEVRRKDEKLLDIGPEAYLEGMPGRK